MADPNQKQTKPHDVSVTKLTVAFEHQELADEIASWFPLVIANDLTQVGAQLIKTSGRCGRTFRIDLVGRKVGSLQFRPLCESSPVVLRQTYEPAKHSKWHSPRKICNKVGATMSGHSIQRFISEMAHHYLERLQSLRCEKPAE
jgi:hypothetical protein